MESANKKQKTLTSFFSRGTIQSSCESSTFASRDANTLLKPGESSFVQHTETEGICVIDNSLSVPSSSTEDSTISRWPSIWTEEMWERKKNAFPWLDCINGKLGCNVCKEVAQLGTFKKERMSISKEWRLFLITFNGSSKTSQLTSLRKKIFEHKNSFGHTTAERIAAEAKKESIDKVFDEMNAAHLVTTKIVFRTAYFIAKNNRPCTDHFDLLQMQKLNGLDIGVGLHSKRIAMEIICHVSDEMKKRVVKQILGVSGKISVLIDESTTLGSKSTLIVYLKCEVCKEDSPHFLFLDLLELSDQTSKTVAENLLDCLSKYGFEDNYLKENFVAFASDGASVMLGKKSGVAERLLEKYPSLIIWHCMNHRLELALSDAINEVGAVNHFQIFMDKVYSVYSRSPKNQRELAECASGLDQEINKIGKILGTRWVASSFRAVSATWYGYGALNRHFDFAKADKSRNLTERAMYSGLSKRCSSPQFLLDLAIMYDILAELSMLSESLQNQETTVIYADKLIRRSVRFFEAMKENPGTKTLEAKICIREGTFNGVPLIENHTIPTINHQQLITSVINNLKRRMFTTVSSHEPHRSSAPSHHHEAYESLLDELKVLEPDTWPTEKPAGFGEPEIEKLCRRFKLNIPKIKNSYRDFVENHTTIPKHLTPLLNCTKLIPCSSADCERGFSLMNLIITPTRTRLTVPHVSSLMFVKLHGPNLSDWDPEPYVKTWLRKHRTADDTRTKQAKPTTLEESNPFAKYL